MFVRRILTNLKKLLPTDLSYQSEAETQPSKRVEPKMKLEELADQLYQEIPIYPHDVIKALVTLAYKLRGGGNGT